MLINISRPVKHSFTEVDPLRAWLRYNNVFAGGISYNDVYHFYDIELDDLAKIPCDKLIDAQTPEFKYEYERSWNWKDNNCILAFRLWIYYSDEVVLQNVETKQR